MREAAGAVPAGSADAFWEKLESGARVCAVELDSPRDGSAASFMEGARVLRDAGADAVTIADCPMGRPRADSCLMACKLKRELGVEALPHLTCRDRNGNALTAALLGLSMEGVRNLLIVTGDPLPPERPGNIKAVYQYTSRTLARRVQELNETVLETPLRVFGALNVNSNDFTRQIERAKDKARNGVAGFFTQPVLSPEALDNLKRARDALPGKILGGIFPPVSDRNARFLNDNVGGIRVSDEILALYEGRDRAGGEAVALELAVRIAEQVKPYTDGLYLMTPFQRTALMARILEQVR